MEITFRNIPRFLMLMLVVLITSSCNGDIDNPAPTNTSAGTSTTPAPVTLFLAEGATLDIDKITNLFETGQLYFDVKGTNKTPIEIRGGILPSSVVYQTDSGDPFTPNPSNNPVTYATLLSGDQVRPRNVVTTATGYGSVTLDPLSKRLTGFIISSGISGISGRIHDGDPGSAGGIVINLVGGPIVWTVPTDVILNDSQIARLGSGSYYFSVNSSVFPDGEIRGQLNQQVRVADLTGSSEVPPVTTSATGTGILAVNPSTRQFSGIIKASGLSSPILSVILHSGAEGTNGALTVILTDNGNGVWSIPPNTVLGAAQISSFNNTALYFNIHTQNNPGGEVRGQLKVPTIKIGTAALNTVTVTPTTVVSATGQGILAWNSITGQVSGSVNTYKLDGIAATIQSGSQPTTASDLLALTTSSPITVPPTPGISYTLDIQPIFTARCLGGACHSTGGFAPMSLETGVSYPFVRLLLVPGNSTKSYLFQRLTVNNPPSLPQMPLNRAPLSVSDLTLIQDWINKGALNN